MPSTYTTSNRLEKQAAGENNNTWGDRLNDNVIGLADEAMDGVVAFSLSGSKTLTTSNAATDEARQRVLDVTGGTGGTVTIPNLKKNYIVRNASSGDVTVTSGSGTTATIKSGNTQQVFCDGSNVVRAVLATDFGTSDIRTRGSIGYPQGAGGSVTQIISKSTAVTINKICGRITMHNETMASNTSRNFTVNNSTIGLRDCVIVHIGGNASANSYIASCDGVNVGLFVVSLRNISTSSLGEAVTINFAIIKSYDS